MKKKIRQRMMNQESVRQRRLELSQETVRTLGHDELLHAVGGSGCDTGSTPTQTSHR